MTEFLSSADARIAEFAGRQHGVVNGAQLSAVGIDKDGVAWRVGAGRLHRLHRGVYAVGHRSLSWRGRWLAAVFAAGDGAVLSHSSAAALWGFLRPIQGPTHVTVTASRRPRTRPGIIVHRSRSLSAATGRPDGGWRGDMEGEVHAAAIVTRRHGIPVTTAARTIEDIRRELESYLYRRALRQAELAGHRVPNLVVTRRTRSDLELLFLALCEAHGLPRPEVNARIAGRLVDFLFREHRLAVETDSWTYHRGSVAFEDDHARDLALRAVGLNICRYTAVQLETAADAVAADLRSALHRSAAVGQAAAALVSSDGSSWRSSSS